MANKYTRKTVEDILNISGREFGKLNEREMRQMLGKLVSAGNKRLRSFERAGETSPATRAVMSSGGQFSTRGKNLNELRAEFARARNFMNSATGSRRGWKDVKAATAKQLQSRGVDVQPAQLNDVLNVYERLKEIDPTVSSMSLKYRVLQEITRIDESEMSYEEKVGYMQERIADIYEEWAEAEQDVSDYFEM